MTDEKIRNVWRCSPLLPEPGEEVVKELIVAIVEERAARNYEYEVGYKWVGATGKAKKLYIDTVLDEEIRINKKGFYAYIKTMEENSKERSRGAEG